MSAPIPIRPDVSPPLPPPLPPQLAEATTAPAPPTATSLGYGVADRWRPILVERWTPLSDVFIRNTHRLGRNGEPLSPVETLVVIHLMYAKRGAKNPRAALQTIATRVDRDIRTVRTAVATLEGLGLLKRIHAEMGGVNAYDMTGLFDRLEALLVTEAAEAAVKAAG